MWNVVQFPRTSTRDRTSGVRVAYFAGRWCVERLEQGIITDRRFMPAQSDAERIAVRIARRDKVTLLTGLRSRPRPSPSFHLHTPDDAA
ncbi:hypothetical protein FOHLNKBM_5522 [Methylobacterium longum]|uniref:hypothetical protein n=1 Tax=Methylobacterium longum TaxID=767694 RepID=UPI001EE36F68|nr:hypothetical protein [Methylobacterium longum]GJE14447.1 hypothetical protein FOHLNKBM_5522 [Methylobacterium longum]